MSGRKVEMLSNLPRASSAWSNLLRKSGVQSMDGFGGNDAGTKARAFSPSRLKSEPRDHREGSDL